MKIPSLQSLTVVAPPTQADFEAHKARCPFTVEILGQRLPFETLNEASGLVREAREQSGLGASGLGCQFPIRNKAGREVAYVSYNGCIWNGTRKQNKGVQLFPVQSARALATLATAEGSAQ